MKKKYTNAVMDSGNEKLLHAAKCDADQILIEYDNTESGFTEERADEVRDEKGENIITRSEKETLLQRIISSFINPFTAILFVLAIISLFTDVIFAPESSRDPTAAIIVLVMVTVSGILRFVQEQRSSNAAEKLAAMITTTTCVIRDGVRREVPISEVVVGDIVCLASGDMVPADVRMLTTKDLFVSESSLTGESNPVEKVTKTQKFSHRNSLELPNLAFMGSNVVSGSATSIVIAIGDETQLGRVAKTLVKKKELTSFEKGINSTSWLLIRFMFIMVPIVFIVNGITKGVVLGGGGGAWLDALLFGLAVAVGLTPEMLPMIVTTGLAKGTVRMSHQKCIVKNMNSIQNFGAVDVLCTDKTGTLTEDEIALERYLDIKGNSDHRILRHAYLNSYFQTGVRNVMDAAILRHSGDGGLKQLAGRYTKVDEIPFDFTRRRMSVVIGDEAGKTQVITKGAVEEMLDICTFAEYKEVVALTAEIKAEILATVKKLNSEGLRVLGVAQKTNPPKVGVFSVQDERDMVFIGYLAFLDPPKASAKAAIAALGEHGVTVKVLTGDSLDVTRCISRQVGLDADKVLVGSQIASMSDEELSVAVEITTIFAKLTPEQKTRVVSTLKHNGHVVGFMGDGINDAPALREADVGISVDSAVDIAKEAADIILLEKDLMVLEHGIIEGRKTFANIVKYIKMTASSNFGNMFAVLAASAFLPFMPMLPIQLLLLNLIYDISCISIPWDNVDAEYINKPKKWDTNSIGKFMLWMGPISSVFDIATFIVLYFFVCPFALGMDGNFASLTAQQQLEFTAMFQAGWFVESLWSQTIVIYMIRTAKIPFVQSNPSLPVIGFTTLGLLIGTVIPFTPLAPLLSICALTWHFFICLFGIILAYICSVTIAKKFYIKRYGSLL